MRRIFAIALLTQIIRSQLGCQCGEYDVEGCRAPCQIIDGTCQTQKNCSLATNSSQCWYPNCYWNQGKCKTFVSCNQTNVTEYTKFASDQRFSICMEMKCSLNATSSFCSDRYSACSSHTDQGTCLSSIELTKNSKFGFNLCVWSAKAKGDKCMAYRGCTGFKDLQWCAIDKSCEWNKKESGCGEVKCKNLLQCDRIGCQKIENVCRQYNCGSYKSREQCRNSQNNFLCAWKGGTCNQCAAIKTIELQGSWAMMLGFVFLVFVIE